MNKKIRIAIITHGGIGTGSNGEGMPLLMDILSLLAEQFDIKVYSLEKFDVNFFTVPALYILHFFQMKVKYAHEHPTKMKCDETFEITPSYLAFKHSRLLSAQRRSTLALTIKHRE